MWYQLVILGALLLCSASASASEKQARKAGRILTEGKPETGSSNHISSVVVDIDVGVGASCTFPAIAAARIRKFRCLISIEAAKRREACHFAAVRMRLLNSC